MTQNLMMVCEAKLVLENQGNEPTGKIEAVVTTWGAREGADGRRFNYQPEAFMDWAEAFTKEGRPLPMFVNHDADAIPVGEWTAFEFDDKGMSAQGRIYMNTTSGKDLYQVMRESPNMFGGVSVGAYAEEYQWTKEDGTPMTVGSDNPYEDGYFQITKGGLREVSVVMYPNNPEAGVQKLEFFRADGTADLKVLERALRDANLSKKDAVTAASIFKKVMEQREAPAPIENAPQLSDSDVDVTESEILKALNEREILKTLNSRLKG
jgi:HK97 family phage prohead protease